VQKCKYFDDSLAMCQPVLIASILLQSGNMPDFPDPSAAERTVVCKRRQRLRTILSKVSVVGAVLFIVCSLALKAIE
jgi:preprotein translocase subunit SecG